ncbi:hypothetical protein MTO96_031196 [Rhipicephalus appendiculatus]
MEVSRRAAAHGQLRPEREVGGRSACHRRQTLVRFCAILGVPKPVHHKTATGKKVHAGAMKAENLARARELTADGSMNVAVMFDGTRQKRGHKSHNGVGTATGLCFDFQVLSNYCLSCSRHKALEEEEICDDLSSTRNGDRGCSTYMEKDGPLHHTSAVHNVPF